MSYVAKKCGIQLQPPSIVLIYEDPFKQNLRKRIMPIRNFTKFSDCSRAAEQLKNNPRHKTYLEGVSLEQLKKLHNLLRCHLQGQTLSQSLKKVEQNETVDPEEDLNKLNDEELAQRKRIMDELFEKNRKRKEDPDFIYNVEVEFPQDKELEACEWDTETEDEF
ncbi:centrosomal protein of 19 kDa [Protobothrops mucrosquamatus]|uniref:centrosomal protein of 19 kDa n=1 Tax=Protobothrops mucrosquamatus TaxID=103944 RepID=UPI000775EB99|nr:centrosomal protein of 19 kDa [Protobothrops mucrosquamatus]